MSTDFCQLNKYHSGSRRKLPPPAYQVRLISTLQSAVNCFSAPYYQDYEQSTKCRTMVDPTIHLSFLAVIINNTDMA